MRRVILTAALCCAAAPAAAQDPAETGRVYMLTEVTAPPRPANVAELRAALEAAYPAELRAAGREGTVMVSMVVSPDGATREVNVIESTEPGFDSATVAALRQLRFTPAAVDGRPVAVRLELPILWQLSREEEPAPVTEPSAEVTAGADPVIPGVRVYELRAVEEPPRPRNLQILRQELMRRYPPRLRSAGQGGSVTARFRVDEQGDVKDVRIVRSSNVEFNQPTAEVVRQLKFSPARLGGQPVQVWVELPIQWTAPTQPRPEGA